MRVLSRRSNLPKAVACGYSEGAGFAVLTEPSPCPVSPLLPVVHMHLSDGVRGPPLGVYSGVPGAAGSSLWQCPPAERPSALRRGEATTSRRRRRAVSVAQRPREPGSWHSARPVHVPPPSAAEAGARRRRRAPAEDSSRRRRRALPRAGDGCCRLVVSVTEAEAMGTAG